MRAILLMAALVVAVPDRPNPTPKDAAKPIAEQLVGEWRLVSGVYGGTEKKEADGTTMTFTPTEIHIIEKGQGRRQEDATYRLDDKRKPVGIDIMPKQMGNQKIEGILKIEGDMLTLCFAHGGRGDRPLDFASLKDTRVALLLFQRIKK